MTVPTFMLGDLQVQGRPSPKLTKALAILSRYLHPLFNEWGSGFAPGKSYESCILASAVTRDYLFRLGFRDADVRPVACFISAKLPSGELGHTLGIGDPRLEPGENVIEVNGTARWNGHAVVVTQGFLIDTTLYQAQRPEHWPGLPPMVATPLNESDMEPFWGLPILAGATGYAENGSETGVLWLDQPFNTGWQTSPDYLRRHERKKISDKLVALFGKWTDQ